jgi:UDPglucose 6-dehydrogenase
VSNPEFLKEGAAIGDFMKPDRVVIGTDSARATELLRSLYEPFTRNRDRMIVMDVRSAELTKYAANAMLATKISFMNELANLAEHFRRRHRGGARRHRLGSAHRLCLHLPGRGLRRVVLPQGRARRCKRSADEVGYDASILSAVESVNNRQKADSVQQDQGAFRRFAGKTIAVWGLGLQAQYR